MFSYPEQATIVNAFRYIGRQANKTAKEKGWWKDERNIGEILMLIVSEIAEALEAYRETDLENENLKDIFYIGNKPEGFTVELADALIRIFDTCHAMNLPIGTALIEKMKYNETRPYKHGGKNA